MKKLAVLRSLFSLLAVLAFVLGACTQSAAVQSESSQESGSSGSSQSSQSESYSFVYTAYYDETKIDLCASRDLSKNVWASNDDNGGRLIVEQGGSETTVYSVGAGYRIYRPLWSPNGQYIAFQLLDTSKSYEITQAYIYNTASGSVTDTKLTTGLGLFFGGMMLYSWSVDSAKLMVQSWPIYYWDVAASKSVLVSDESVLDEEAHVVYHANTPAFSPDGTKIAYQMGYNAGEILKVYDCTTGARREICKLPTKENFASEWYPQPTFWISETEVLNGALGYDILYKINIITGEKTEFLKNVGRPILSPDGKYLAYNEKIKDGAYQAVILNLSNLSKITAGNFSPFEWSADSKILVLYEYPDKVRAVDVKGSQIGKTITEAIRISGAEWTKNGLWHEIAKPIQ